MRWTYETLTSELEQQNAPPLQLLSEHDLEQLMLTPNMVRFGYNFNRPGSIVMLVFSGILLAGAVGLWLWTSFAQFWWFLAAALMVIGAVGLWAYVYKWHTFTQTAFLALSEEHLYVGDASEAWRMSWSLLDPQTLGFDRLNPSRYSSTLTIDLAGQNIDMFLYNPLAHVNDLQGFMIEVLTQLQGEDLALQLEGDDGADAERQDKDHTKTASTSPS